MTPFVFAAITPHGLPLVPELSADAEGAMATRTAMEELGRRFTSAHAEVIVIATPHGIRVDDAICLAASARAAGTLHWRGQQSEMNIPIDMALTDAITNTARANHIPIALASFAGNQRDQSVIPLDWGTQIPLRFLGHTQNMVGYGDTSAGAPSGVEGPPVVIAAPSRRLNYNAMVKFGRAIADACAQDGRRIAFIASCDWSHTHTAEGPYGYHPAAAEVDAIVVQALKDGEPGRLIELSQDQVEKAAIDGLWQTLMLAGILERFPMQSEVLSYEVPSYYGMCVAHFAPLTDMR